MPEEANRERGVEEGCVLVTEGEEGYIEQPLVREEMRRGAGG